MTGQRRAAKRGNPDGVRRDLAALRRRPELALAAAVGHRSDAVPAWVADRFAGWDRAELRAAALTRIALLHGPGAAAGAAGLADRGTPAALDALVIGLDRRPGSGFTEALNAAISARSREVGDFIAVVADAEVRDRGRGVLGHLLTFLAVLGLACPRLAPTLTATTAHLDALGPRRARMSAAARFAATFADPLLDALGELSWHGRPRTRAQSATADGCGVRPLLARMVAALALAAASEARKARGLAVRAALLARVRRGPAPPPGSLRGRVGHGAPPVTGPPSWPWANLPGSAMAALPA